MLVYIRQGLKSHAYRIFLLSVLVVFILGGLARFEFGASSEPSGKWLAKIYDQEVSLQRFNTTLAMTKQRYAQFARQGFMQPMDHIESDVLKNLVQQELVENTVQNSGIFVGAQTFEKLKNQQLAGLPDTFFLPDGQLNVPLFERAIAPHKLSDFIKDIEREAAGDIFDAALGSCLYISNQELLLQYNDEYADKTYSVIELPLSKSLDEVKKEKVSDDVLQKFYVQESVRFKSLMLPEKRKGVSWKFGVKEYGLTVTDEQVELYWKDHQQEFVQHPEQIKAHRIVFAIDDKKKAADVKTQAEKVHEQLVKDPKKFNDLAKKHGVEKFAKSKMYSEKDLEGDKVLSRTLFQTLTQDDQISDVIKTKEGYEIVQRLSKKDAEYKTLEHAKKDVEAKLLQQKFAQRFMQDAQRLISGHKYNEKSVDDFIDRKKGKKDSIALREKKGGDVVVNHLFTTEQGSYSVFMDKEDGVLVFCEDVEKSVMPPFADVKEKVEKEWQKEQAQKHLEKAVKALFVSAQNSSLEQAAQETKEKIHAVKATYEHDVMNKDALIRGHEIAQKLSYMTKPGSLAYALESDKALVVRLDEIAPVNQELFAQKKESMKKMIQMRRKYELRDSLIASLYSRAKLDGSIQFNSQFLPQSVKVS